MIEERMCGKGTSVAAEFRGVVTDVREESRVAGVQRWQVALESGEAGMVAEEIVELEAVARSGAKLVVAVLQVVEDDAGQRWYLVEKPLATGTIVTGRTRLG